ncbi:hypothetical protein ES319_A03G014300v1 [Gossypium barbadense]|uniref:Peptidase A1 domain-containing protein n=2 Tax=Gossypium TaxID=3633 RepID=A0A5J5W9S1_GOSBA|nr:hypothetical protein ES319_A03G014300v1 [Gossypium barbadense]TYH23473.1 hypothetical protein ES288_A03G016500v1 [Gossypium darwinii]
MVVMVTPLCLLYWLLISTWWLMVSTSGMVWIPLTHSLSKTQFTTPHHLLKTTSTRSATRFRQHHHHRHKQVSVPLSPGSDYTLSFTLGSPSSSTISLYLDTGSDLVWLPCSPFECILCESKTPPLSPPLNLSSSATAVPCKSSACSAAHSSLHSSDLCAIARCPLDSIEMSECNSFPCPPFYYAYGDGSLIGRLYKDSLTLPNSLSVQNFTFGCSHTTLGEPVGVAGFGFGRLSLPAQLSSVSPQLEGISVGKRNIPAPENLKRVDRRGSGGMVVDSGTTFTMLPASLYDSVVTEFDHRVSRFYKRANTVEESTGLSPCYFYNKVVAAKVPAIKLHFAGNRSSVVLPRKNYFYEFVDGSDGGRKKRNVGCLMLMNGGDEEELSGGPGATLGNYQQQGFEVVYDLEKRKVGFARRKCSSLWDSLKN